MEKYFHILLLRSWTVHVRKWITMVIMTNTMTESKMEKYFHISPNSSTLSNAMD